MVDSSSAEELLKKVSKFNDAVQAWMFNPDALAPTFPESMITKPFPFNAYYDVDDAPEIDGKDWKLEVRGLVDNKKSWTLDELYQAAAGQAGDAPYLRRGLERDRQLDRHAAARLPQARRRRHAGQICLVPVRRQGRLQLAAGHAARALHPQTQMTFKFADEILPRAYGYPMKIRVPTKLGFKNPKYVISMEVTNDYKGGYWEDQGYNSFSGS